MLAVEVFRVDIATATNSAAADSLLFWRCDGPDTACDMDCGEEAFNGRNSAQGVTTRRTQPEKPAADDTCLLAGIGPISSKNCAVLPLGPT